MNILGKIIGVAYWLLFSKIPLQNHFFKMRCMALIVQISEIF